MFNGRRERGNVSFPSSNADASSPAPFLSSTRLLITICINTPSRLCGSQQLLCCRVERGADMRGSAGKLVFTRKRTGQVGARLFKAARAANRRRSRVASHFTAPAECGSKREDAGASTGREGELCAVRR